MECEITGLGEATALPTYSLKAHTIAHIYTVQVISYRQSGRFVIL